MARRYIYLRFHSSRLWSLESERWQRIIFGAMPARLKPRRFSTLPHRDLASPSNLIDFNSASQFREIYRPKREARPFPTYLSQILSSWGVGIIIIGYVIYPGAEVPFFFFLNLYIYVEISRNKFIVLKMLPRLFYKN